MLIIKSFVSYIYIKIGKFKIFILKLDILNI